jgi:hypothetical protein
MKVLELPQRPMAVEEEPPLPPTPPPGPVQSGLRRVADEALDRVDPVGFGRALASEAAGLLRHPLSTAGAVARWANGALVATGVSLVRAGGLPQPGADAGAGQGPALRRQDLDGECSLLLAAPEPPAP